VGKEENYINDFTGAEHRKETLGGFSHFFRKGAEGGKRCLTGAGAPPRTRKGRKAFPAL